MIINNVHPLCCVCETTDKYGVSKKIYSESSRNINETYLGVQVAVYFDKQNENKYVVDINDNI